MDDQRESCVVCGRKMDFDEPVTISETGLGGVCGDCAALVEYVYQSGVEGMLLTKEDADALARKWAAGEVAPEDFDDRIAEWKSEQAVRQAVKEGELHQKQVTEELERRKKAGQFGYDTPAFEDRHPMPGYAENKARRDEDRRKREVEIQAEQIERKKRDAERWKQSREAFADWSRDDLIDALIDEGYTG